MECCDYIIHDEHSGDDVCTGCGKVISSLASTIPTSHTSTIAPTKQVCTAIDELSDLCVNNHIERSILQKAISLLSKHKEPDRYDVAYSLYQACYQSAAPRTMHEIAAMCKCSPTQLSNRHNGIDRISPSALVERLSHKFNIVDYNLRQEIKRVADNLSNGQLDSSPPRAVVAAAFYITVRKSTAITVRETAEKCGISAACLRRLVNTLHKHVVPYWNQSI